jgi:uncharacterized protein (TIGR00251 family)
VKLTLIVPPHSKKPRITQDSQEILHVYVSQPPLEGKANQAVIKALAAHFGVAKNRVLLLSGQTSKLKVFELKD